MGIITVIVPPGCYKEDMGQPVQTLKRCLYQVSAQEILATIIITNYYFFSFCYFHKDKYVLTASSLLRLMSHDPKHRDAGVHADLAWDSGSFSSKLLGTKQGSSLLFQEQGPCSGN